MHERLIHFDQCPIPGTDELNFASGFFGEPQIGIRKDRKSRVPIATGYLPFDTSKGKGQIVQGRMKVMQNMTDQDTKVHRDHGITRSPDSESAPFIVNIKDHEGISPSIGVEIVRRERILHGFQLGLCPADALIAAREKVLVSHDLVLEEDADAAGRTHDQTPYEVSPDGAR